MRTMTKGREVNSRNELKVFLFRYVVFFFTDLDRKLLNAYVRTSELCHIDKLVKTIYKTQQFKSLHFSARPMPGADDLYSRFSFENREYGDNELEIVFTSWKKRKSGS
jgi:hypothetical protein